MTSAGESQFIKKVNNIVNKRISDEHFGVSELADAMHISRVTLHRRVRKHYNKTVNAVIREIRLKKALEMILNDEGTISEIAYEVGFGSATYFNKCFHDFYGHSPGDVLKGKIPVSELSNAGSPKYKFGKSTIIISLIALFVLVCSFIIYKQTAQNYRATIIAVLPPKDISHGEHKCEILEGFYESVQVKLNVIEKCNTVPRLITEKYRNKHADFEKAANELNADYILEITGQCSGKKNVIWVNFIESSKMTNLWSYPFEREIKDENFYTTQVDLAELVANTLDVQINLREKNKLNKLPTHEPRALQKYNRGVNELNRRNTARDKYYLKAKQYFEEAIQIDPGFADAYLSIGKIYISNIAQFEVKKYLDKEKYESSLDTGYIYIDRSIELGVSDLKEAFLTISRYHQFKGQHTEALKYFNRAWKSEKRSSDFYMAKANYLYRINDRDNYQVLANFFKAKKKFPVTKTFDTWTNRQMANTLAKLDYTEEALYFAGKYFDKIQDSSRYNGLVHNIEIFSCNYKSLSDRMKKNNFYKPDNPQFIQTKIINLVKQGEFNHAYPLVLQTDSMQQKLNNSRMPDLMYGNCYLAMGDTINANWHLKNQLVFLEQNIQEKNLDPRSNATSFLNLAACYAQLGMKTEAIETLNQLYTKKFFVKMEVMELHTLGLFDFLIDEPEYIRIKEYIEFSYNSQRKKVRKLLIKNGFEPA